MRTASQPRLYDATPDTPVLNGVVCTHCDRVYFPPMGIGCEICGATDAQLASRALETVGTVFAMADVHISTGDTPTPFTVAEIVLDAGPLIRTMIHPESAPLQIGDRVRGRWHVVDRGADGADIVEPAFEVAGAKSGAEA